MSKCLQVFAKELALISDWKIREWTQGVFDEIAPNYFWTIPASQRGHHPPICRTTGGLVHHIKLAVEFAHCFVDMWFDFDEAEHDMVIAGVLLHDLFKRGVDEDCLVTFESKSHACNEHGHYAASRIRSLMDHSEKLRSLLPAKQRDTIIRAVELHMGRWTGSTGYTLAERADLLHNRVVSTVHLADYAASRSLHRFLGERYVDRSNDAV